MKKNIPNSYISLHIIKTLPFNACNCDESGNPKTGSYGGVTRIRTSSQSQKRSARRMMEEELISSDNETWRTRAAGTIVYECLQKLEPSLTPDEAEMLLELYLSPLLGECISKTLDKNGVTPFLFCQQQAERVAQVLLEEGRDNLDKYRKAPGKYKSKSGKKEFKVGKQSSGRIIEAFGSFTSPTMALFGRMCAKTKELSLDSACSVSHAMSTHAGVIEADFFSATEDYLKADAGSSHMNDTMFSSSTFYQHAVIDVRQLCENMTYGDQVDRDAVIESALAAVRALAFAVPTGKQHAFASFAAPAYICLALHDTQPFSMAGAFESPVRSFSRNSQTGAYEENGYEKKSVEKLEQHMTNTFSIMGGTPSSLYVSSLHGPSLLTEIGARQLPFQDALEEIRVQLEKVLQ